MGLLDEHVEEHKLTLVPCYWIDLNVIGTSDDATMGRITWFLYVLSSRSLEIRANVFVNIISISIYWPMEQGRSTHLPFRD